MAKNQKKVKCSESCHHLAVFKVILWYYLWYLTVLVCLAYLIRKTYPVT